VDSLDSFGQIQFYNETSKKSQSQGLAKHGIWHEDYCCYEMGQYDDCTLGVGIIIVVCDDDGVNINVYWCGRKHWESNAVGGSIGNPMLWEEA
jgi:hypothetical protein